MDETGIAMVYHCAKFGDFSFSRFGFIVRTDRHRITEADQHKQLPSALVIIMSLCCLQKFAVAIASSITRTGGREHITPVSSEGS